MVLNGKVEGIYKKLPPLFSRLRVNDFGRRLILPGFVDLHVHSSQFYQSGVGLDQNLIPWLYSHTFPLEGRFADPEFAGRPIRGLWRS